MKYTKIIYFKKKDRKMTKFLYKVKDMRQDRIREVLVIAKDIVTASRIAHNDFGIIGTPENIGRYKK